MPLENPYVPDLVVGHVSTVQAAHHNRQERQLEALTERVGGELSAIVEFDDSATAGDEILWEFGGTVVPRFVAIRPFNFGPGNFVGNETLVFEDDLPINLSAAAQTGGGISVRVDAFEAGRVRGTVLSGLGSPAQSNIGNPATGNLCDGDLFTLNDGINPPVTLEVDTLGNGVAPGNVLVDFSDGPDFVTGVQRFINAINGIPDPFLLEAFFGASPTGVGVRRLTGGPTPVLMITPQSGAGCVHGPFFESTAGFFFRSGGLSATPIFLGVAGGSAKIQVIVLG